MKIYRLQELKSNQLKKLYLNGNITEEQYKIADDFFKKYSSYEKEIDWNKGLKITWDELEKVIYKKRDTKSQIKNKIRKGLEGFEEGKDYLVISEGTYLGKPWVAYQPFTWEASRMIASHYVEPSENSKGEIKDAGWCTAYQKDKTYWNKHNKIEAFIYLCGETIPTSKVAISISEEERDASGSEFLYTTDSFNYNIWDFNDYNITIRDEEIREIIPSLDELIEKAYENWDNISNVVDLKYNPKTGRYDYDGSLSLKRLKRYIKPNGDGFTINFGNITGSFDCSSSNLTSLKGAPQKVGGRFDCTFNRLTSLKGAPTDVDGDFYCAWNKLISLEGAPQKVGRDFNCDNNNLTSLEGAPQMVKGDFYCRDNPNLHSLEGIGEVRGWITKDF